MMGRLYVSLFLCLLCLDVPEHGYNAYFQTQGSFNVCPSWVAGEPSSLQLEYTIGFHAARNRTALDPQEQQAHNKQAHELAIAKFAFNSELGRNLEHLELSINEQQIHPTDSTDDQLKKELLRLQEQNSSLARKEQELKSSLQVQEFLQGEVLRLQEANEHLETQLVKYMEAAADPLLLEKCVTLETELAEAMDANNLYRLQLKGILDKPENIDTDALKSFFQLKWRG
ncbi:hypothetical protein L7F22_068614 [Adiantum nelumboides]|nr:hypothetical protein [Adiantum nelumboides]